jgi:HAD superfamily hydrolase (TIGR01484 family)
MHGRSIARRRTMQPLNDCPAATLAAVRGVLADIDDTLTTDGRLPAAAYAAMEAVQRAGLLMIPITGRPAGWCDHIARMWPVDGVVGENGAFWFRYDVKARRMVRRYVEPDAARARNRERLAVVRDRILAAVPGCAVAADQRYREADLAIDFREDVPPLPAAAIDRIVALMQEAGMTAKVSSIHVNGWFGRYDKLGMTRSLLAEAFGIDADAEKARLVFAGDSPNDAPMFAFFPNAVGVANVRDFALQLTAHPAWITHARGGAGFAELVATLLAARAAGA